MSFSFTLNVGGKAIFPGWILVGLIAVTGPLAKAVIDRTVERTFLVNPTELATVDLETFYGNIKVTKTGKSEVHLLVRETLEAESESEADRQLRDLNLQIDDAGNRVSVKADYRRSIHWSWEKWPPLGLSFEIEVPVRCNLRVISREGTLTIPALQGDVEARSFRGEIFIGSIEGNVSVVAGQGNVTVTTCTKKLSVEARSGNVLVGRSEGPAAITAVGGTVEMQSSHGQLRVRGDGTDLKVGFVYPLRGDADVRASGGDVEASFESTLAAQIEARASTFGQVHLRNLDLKLTSGQVGDSHLEGTLNGGGPKLDLRASGGNLRLLGVPAVSGF